MSILFFIDEEVGVVADEVGAAAVASCEAEDS